jgi:TrmH family RNA methyltransferase
MISRSQVKYINSLKLSKFREKHMAFVAEGPKLVYELLKSQFEIETVLATATWLQENQTQISEIESVEISPAELIKISSLKTPNQVLAVVRIPEYTLDASKLKIGLTIALHDIRDPGNMGTIIRSADWFGVKIILCSNDCVDIYNPKVVQSSMGSLTRVKVFYQDLPSLFSIHKDLMVYGAFMEGESIHEETLKEDAIVLIGNESQGIPEKLYPYIDKRICIPPVGGFTESLNAGVAASIILSEFRRQSLAGKQN